LAEAFEQEGVGMVMLVVPAPLAFHEVGSKVVFDPVELDDSFASTTAEKGW
jgi:hypothetical protein